MPPWWATRWFLSLAWGAGTLLAVQATSVARPLHVDIVDTLDPTTLDGSGAIPSLKAIAEHPTFPLTLTADYRTLGTIEAATSGPAATKAEPHGQWRARGRNIRPALSRGPDAWRASGFPR